MNHTEAGSRTMAGAMKTGAAMQVVRRGTAWGAIGVLLAAAAVAAALAQDVPGLEVCTAESRMERRTGCLQSNIEFLQRVITKNALDAEKKLMAAGREIAALKEQQAAAGREQAALKEMLAAMDARIAKLEKAAAPPKPDARPQGK
jgi:septal ring factor EnvC (AmiA/AmiB activator)